MSQYTSYYLYQKYEKRGEQDWIPVYPNTYSIDGDGTMPLSAKTENDPACGYVPVEPIYRWFEAPSTDYVCNGYNKYHKEYYQVSNDNGVTWTNVVPEQTRQGSLIEANSTDCGYIPPTGYSTQYLTFVPEEDGTFTFNGTSANTSIQYSIDSGSTWVVLASSASTPTVTSGNKIMWKAEATPGSTSNNFGIGNFSSTGYFDVEGNVMSLLYGDAFENKTNLSDNNYAFKDLFRSCNKLISAENLILPAMALSKGCYDWMFYNCSSLEVAPKLPAITLGELCYNGTFSGCTSLTTAPELPATILAPYCYYDMFAFCTSLTNVPSLSATTLANHCCYKMFSTCMSLVTPPELPATTLAPYCYNNMFYYCKSLTKSPVLPATTLVTGCYMAMFRACTSINNIKCLATNIGAAQCTSYWVEFAPNSGTFIKNSSMSSWPSGMSGIPSGWTVQNA